MSHIDAHNHGLILVEERQTRGINHLVIAPKLEVELEGNICEVLVLSPSTGELGSHNADGMDAVFRVAKRLDIAVQLSIVALVPAREDDEEKIEFV